MGMGAPPKGLSEMGEASRLGIRDVARAICEAPGAGAVIGAENGEEAEPWPALCAIREPGADPTTT